MPTPVHVEILDRTYTLRVDEDNAERTRRVADKVDGRMRAFQRQHPEQAKLTTAIITALALAEDLHAEREKREARADALNGDLRTLTRALEDALDGNAPADAAQAAEASSSPDGAST